MKVRRLVYIMLIGGAVLVGIGAGVVAVHMSDLPEISALEEYHPSATTRVFADDGELVAEFYMENRNPVQLSQVPPHVINAFLATEDPRFFSHSGIDLIGIMRAMINNIRARRIVQGGSTITQQLAKLLFLVPEKSYTRKIKEAMLALQIERRYSKEEILSLYLNQVYLGSGAYGVDAAARTYFGKTVDQLTLAEGALLAGLPAAPNRYSPFNDPQRALARRTHVLRRMQEEGFITPAVMSAAMKETLIPAKRPYFVSAKAPYFVEFIRQRLEDKYGSGTLYRGGLNIYTTLNLKLEELAEASLAKGLAEVVKRHPTKSKDLQGAVLVMDPHTGAIKAMVGGTDFSRSQFNRCTQALRQPGSVFKPIVYATAVERGKGPDDKLLDAPVSYPGAVPGRPWRPGNYDNKYEGVVTLRKALAKSLNVATVRLLDEVGVPNAIECARRLGIRSGLQPYLSLALGSSDVTLIEMTYAFAVFDNDGIYTQPDAIEKITDREGRVIEENMPVTRQAVSADTASVMTEMLQGVIQSGTGWQARSLNRPAAGKTGTTSDYNDAWFIGYLPDMVVGVWVGYDDHKPIGNKETGARAALPIWLGVMQGYIKEMNVPAEDFPIVRAPEFRDLTTAQPEPNEEEERPTEEITVPPENGGSPSPPLPPSQPPQGRNGLRLPAPPPPARTEGPTLQAFHRA